jgi:DNA-binding beta-propeller fold protein YncE
VITRPETNTVEIFSPVKRRVVARISQIDNPRGIAVDDAGGRVYIAMAGSNRIAVVKTSDWQVEKLIPVQHVPEKLLWVAETKTLYVSSVRDRVLTVVDPLGGVEKVTLEMNALPQDMLYDPSRHQLLVSLQDLNQVVALDSSDKIVESFKLAASEPTGLALDEGHRCLYVAVRYAVLVLNADDGSELARIAAPGGTDTLILDSADNLLYAAAGDGSVLAIDLTRNKIDHELPTDVKGFSMAYDPSHKMLFFPGGREGRSKLVILKPVGITEQNASQTAANPVTAGQTAMKK